MRLRLLLRKRTDGLHKTCFKRAPPDLVIAVLDTAIHAICREQISVQVN